MGKVASVCKAPSGEEKLDSSVLWNVCKEEVVAQGMVAFCLN